MKTYPLKSKDGKLFAFEVPNYKVSRRRAVKIVNSIPGSKIVRYPKKVFSWFREETFCEFVINGLKFEIWEPFGDNSRYWIGKSGTAVPCNEILVIEEAFKNAW